MDKNCSNCTISKERMLERIHANCIQCATGGVGHRGWIAIVEQSNDAQSDGSTASYYTLPEGATELQDLISHKDLNAQLGEIFRACYRYGQVAHSPKIRDIKKIIFYAQAELARIEKLEDAKC